jgi:hypothetical protein
MFIHTSGTLDKARHIMPTNGAFSLEKHVTTHN